MITLALNTGMASKYFITDLKRAATVLEKPYILLANNVGMTELAEALATIYNRTASSGPFKLGAKQINASSFYDFLKDLIFEKKPSIPFMNFNDPVFIVANGITKEALAAIKVLKIRGVGPFLALNVSGRRDESSIMRLENELQSEFLSEGASGKLYKPSKRLIVVCGISQTVVSNEKNSRSVFCEFPSLVTTLDLEAEHEPLI